MTTASDQKNGQSDRKRNSENANIEYRIMNVECRSNVFCLKKRIYRHPSYDAKSSLHFLS